MKHIDWKLQHCLHKPIGWIEGKNTEEVREQRMIDKIKKLKSLLDELEEIRMLPLRNDGRGKATDLYDAVQHFALAKYYLKATIKKLIIYYGYEPKRGLDTE